MKSLITFFFFVFISIQTFSQTALYVDEDFMNNYRNVVLNTSKNYYGKDISGSPFTTDDFVLGTLIGYEQKYLVRYDAFNDHMLAKRKDDKNVIINKNTITEVTFNDGTKYAVFDYNLDGTKKNGYLEVILNDGTIALYKKVIIKFSPAKKPASGYDKPEPPAFKKGRDRYLISNANGEINSIGTKKDFLKFFPNKKSTIEKFMKSNKIKITKENDLRKLVEFLNSSL